MTWLRRLRLLVGGLFLILAGWWAIRALAERIDRELAAPGTYPNEWGVRTAPLTPAQARAAIALEAALLEGAIDTGTPPARQ
jgi:hypothetical protein